MGGRLITGLACRKACRHSAGTQAQGGKNEALLQMSGKLFKARQNLQKLAQRFDARDIVFRHDGEGVD